MKKVAIHLATGFEEIEAISVIDILRRADIQVDIISVTKDIYVKGTHNITVKSDYKIENIEYDKFDMIILPGGMPGAKNLNEHQELKDRIVSFNESNKFIAAICAAPMVLGELNILRDKKATVYPGFENHLNGAIITNDAVTMTDNIITAKGPALAIDFALKIVEVLLSKEKSSEIAKDLLRK